MTELVTFIPPHGVCLPVLGFVFFKGKQKGRQMPIPVYNIKLSLYKRHNKQWFLLILLFFGGGVPEQRPRPYTVGIGHSGPARRREARDHCPANRSLLKGLNGITYTKGAHYIYIYTYIYIHTNSSCLLVYSLYVLYIYICYCTLYTLLSPGSRHGLGVAGLGWEKQRGAMLGMRRNIAKKVDLGSLARYDHFTGRQNE